MFFPGVFMRTSFSVIDEYSLCSLHIHLWMFCTEAKTKLTSFISVVSLYLGKSWFCRIGCIVQCMTHRAVYWYTCKPWVKVFAVQHAVMLLWLQEWKVPKVLIYLLIHLFIYLDKRITNIVEIPKENLTIESIKVSWWGRMSVCVTGF